MPYLYAIHVNTAHTFASTLLGTALRSCIHSQRVLMLAVTSLIAVQLTQLYALEMQIQQVHTCQ